MTDQVCGAKKRQGHAVYPALEPETTSTSYPTETPLAISWVSLGITWPYDTSRVRPPEIARKVFMVPWTTPTYTEISMSAEIGGYQDDFEERAPRPDEAIRPGEHPRALPNEA